MVNVWRVSGNVCRVSGNVCRVEGQWQCVCVSPHATVLVIL